MSKEISKNTNRKSQQKFNLPQIAHSKSVPIVQQLKKQEFTLRFVNDQMPHYNPNKDKFLNDYFQKSGKGKNIKISKSQTNRNNRKSAKTLPSEQKTSQEKMRPKRQKLMTLQSELNQPKEENVAQISKQQFGNFMEVMRQKLSKR